MTEKSSGGKSFRKIAELSSLGLMLPSSIAVGLFFGYHLDRRLGTQPWMLLLFLLFGIASGFLSLFRGIRKYEREAREEENDQASRGSGHL